MTVLGNVDVWSEVPPDNLKTFPSQCLQSPDIRQFSPVPSSLVSRYRITGAPAEYDSQRDVTWIRPRTEKYPGHA